MADISGCLAKTCLPNIKMSCTANIQTQEWLSDCPGTTRLVFGQILAFILIRGMYCSHNAYFEQVRHKQKYYTIHLLLKVHLATRSCSWSQVSRHFCDHPMKEPLHLIKDSSLNREKNNIFLPCNLSLNKEIFLQFISWKRPSQSG